MQTIFLQQRNCAQHGFALCLDQERDAGQDFLQRRVAEDHLQCIEDRFGRQGVGHKEFSLEFTEKSEFLKGQKPGCLSFENPRRENRRSLHYVPPDFLLSAVALVKFLRLSLCGEPHTWSLLALRGRKSGYAPVEMTKLLQNEQGCPFRPDCRQLLSKFVISTGAKRSGAFCGFLWLVGHQIAPHRLTLRAQASGQL
jgi:hypothetical protein